MKILGSKDKEKLKNNEYTCEPLVGSGFPLHGFKQNYFLQIEDFKKFASQPDVYKALCSKIAPSIFGHDDVKKAVACLLFGGSRKVLFEIQ